MFRATSAHHQEYYLLYIQPPVISVATRPWHCLVTTFVILLNCTKMELRISIYHRKEICTEKLESFRPTDNTRCFEITKQKCKKSKMSATAYILKHNLQCNNSIFQYISKKMQRYTVYLYLETGLHVSGGTSTHHQEHIQLCLQHLVFVTPLLLPAAIVEELELRSNSSSWK
jgi:hypothetical protein